MYKKISLPHSKCGHPYLWRHMRFKRSRLSFETINFPSLCNKVLVWLIASKKGRWLITVGFQIQQLGAFSSLSGPNSLTGARKSQSAEFVPLSAEGWKLSLMAGINGRARPRIYIQPFTWTIDKCAPLHAPRSAPVCVYTHKYCIWARRESSRGLFILNPVSTARSGAHTLRWEAAPGLYGGGGWIRCDQIIWRKLLSEADEARSSWADLATISAVEKDESVWRKFCDAQLWWTKTLRSLFPLFCV